MASDPFVDAAENQAARLGLDTASVFVAHPIQDRTDDEMRTIADAAVDQLIDALTGPS